MAKDPAILFYWNDWNGGTITFSRHMKGCYMDLLHAQFNSGPLSLEEIKTVLGVDFSIWNALKKKFKYDEKSGLFFNERMEAERLKRAEYSLKQKERVLKRWNKDGKQVGNTTVLPKKENEIEIEIKDVSFGKSENLLLKIKDFAVEIENSYSKIEAAARRNKTSPDVIKSMIPDFVDVCITKSKDEDTWYNYCNYFSNWLANEFSKQKNSTQTKSPHQLREMNYNEKP